MMGVEYTNISANGVLSDTIAGNPDLKEDQDLLLTTVLNKKLVGL